MFGNTDIFDEDELLAIANDGDGSSSSSCHSSASEMSKKAGAGSDDEKEIEAASSETEQHHVNKNNNSSSSKPQSKDKKVAEKDDVSSSDDDSDNDDGFLESWFDHERKKKSTATAQSNKQQPDAEDEDDSTSDNGNNKPEIFDEKEKKSSTTIDHVNDKNTIKIEASVLNWITAHRARSSSASSAKRSGGNKLEQPGIIAIEHGHNAKDDASALSYKLKLNNTAANRRKRLREGRGDTMGVTLEVGDNSAGESVTEKMVLCGQAAHTSANVVGARNPGAMIDCIARFDSQKGCYILEIVDLLVNDLNEQSAKASHDNEHKVAQQANIAVDATTIGLSDPLSVAKRADDQLKKLKKGKGRSVPIKKQRVGQQSEGSSADRSK